MQLERGPRRVRMSVYLTLATEVEMASDIRVCGVPMGKARSNVPSPW